MRFDQQGGLSHRGTMISLFLIGYAAAVAGLTALLNRWRPTWRAWLIVTLAVCPIPIATMVLVSFLTDQVKTGAPGEVTAGGVVAVLFVLGGLLLVVATLLIGLPASLLTLWRLRRRR
ncbi:hypothetical protein ACSBM8_02875 [Sphingomonas sp. ASY06-1R]|uniref:hypothetical protein n=1 Tax=Sphingomonas sp. ASY06-1R TaxID=3445771 RepID=UPI003FA201E1